MCCYRSRLVFSCCFVDRATNSRVHHLTLTTPLPARDTVLKNYTNKARLNALICEQVLSDNDFLSNSTQSVTSQLLQRTSQSPRKCLKDKNTPCGSFVNAWLTQQAIHIAKEDPESTVCVVSDNTDLISSFILKKTVVKRNCVQSSYKHIQCRYRHT